MQERCFLIGQHLGLAFQLIDDVIDYTSSSLEMGKEQYGDLREGHITGPLILGCLPIHIQELVRAKGTLSREEL